ncbi:WYL domain-containing protein, partial [Proteus mirabilis]|nr:WYL domain-containing protein [Proteus mirabilis]
AILHSYQSPHGGEVRDRRVEPFAFTTNYVQVWCYDPEAGACKLFKTSRIGSVELTAEAWEHGAEHREGFIDVFRMHGGARHRVRLELGLLAYNLLCEEYPLAERDVRPLGRGRWLLDTQVAGFAGVGRFAVGLLDDIRIVDSPELTAYIRDYIAANKLL